MDKQLKKLLSSNTDLKDFVDLCIQSGIIIDIVHLHEDDGFMIVKDNGGLYDLVYFDPSGKFLYKE